MNSRYYGWNEGDSMISSSSSSEEESEDLSEQILNVQNIADSVLFIS